MASEERGAIAHLGRIHADVDKFCEQASSVRDGSEGERKTAYRNANRHMEKALRHIESARQVLAELS